ncbi:MAG: hypothetical protein L6Q40_00705 [Azonexus sp.]|nr:hypothetical protein [Azonexus sp.]
MLNKLAGVGGLFAQRDVHPLADARELAQIIAALPRNQPLKALDEITGWLESLLAAVDVPAERFFDAVQELEKAAAAPLRRVAVDYLHTSRLARNEEKRMWSLSHNCWRLLGEAYEKVTQQNGVKTVVLAAACAGMIAAVRCQIRWDQYHYGPTDPRLWARMGRCLLLAEQADCAERAVHAPDGGFRSVAGEYLHAMAFQAASVDSLLPSEIDLADHLIAHFINGCVMTREAEHDSVYWVDLAQPQAPLRLARMPAEANPSQRFFKPIQAAESFRELLQGLELGQAFPAEIPLGAALTTRQILPVLHHLAAYLAPVPPQRQDARHQVKHRMAVLHGLVNAYVAFSGEFGGKPAGLQIESWVVENVSRGGIGARVSTVASEWLKVGVLLALQPEGGDNWLLGCVRRYLRYTDNELRIGVETLARSARSVELQLASAERPVPGGIPGLLLMDGNAAGECRLVLPLHTFDPADPLSCQEEGLTVRFEPLALVEQFADYEIARFRRVNQA